MIPRTLVIGSTGFLGRYFVNAFRSQHPDAPSTSRRELDVAHADLGVVSRVAEGCTHALLLAAIPQIDRCEQDPAGTRRVNVDGTLRVAEHLLTLGVTPVFFSSDYVFKGDTGGYADDAPTEPTTEYGRQKVEVEQRLRELGPERSLIVRLSKVYGTAKGDGTLFDAMAATLVKDGTIRAAEDQRFCPTFILPVLRAVLTLLEADVRGTVNVCSPRAMTRFEAATLLHERLGRGRVERTTMAALGFADRPRDTTMRCARLESFAVNFEPGGLSLEDLLDIIAEAWRTA